MHEIVKCSCGALIMQCRCISHNKSVRVLKKGCTDCKKKKLDDRASEHEAICDFGCVDKDGKRFCCQCRKEVTE